MAVKKVLLLGVLGLLACDNRFPVTPSVDGGALDLFGDLQTIADSRPVVPDLPMSTFDSAVPNFCTTERSHLITYVDPRRNMVLGLPRQVKVQPIAHKSAGPNDTIIALSTVDIAGLALTLGLPGPGWTASNVHDHLHQAVARHLVLQKIGQLAVASSGTGGKSPDGYADVKNATWVVDTHGLSNAATLRKHLTAALLSADPAQLSGWPSGVATRKSNRFLIRLTVVWRQGQVAVSVAVVERDSFEALDSPFFALAEDLGNGSALFRYGHGSDTKYHCNIKQLKKNPKADIIWVSDESGSMANNLNDVVRHANTLFTKAKAAGLDFRMGVTGVKKPYSGYVPGRFCSHATSDKYHDGGEDRFLLPSEQALFSSCIRNPPDYEGGSEYGLTNAYFAVKNHLPRHANRPDRIRTDAVLAVILLTDEAPQEIKVGGDFLSLAGFLSSSDVRNTSCVLSDPQARAVKAFMDPALYYFNGFGDPQAKASVHLIGGVCNNQCKAEIGYGYDMLAIEGNGQIGDICQQNLGTTLQLIVNSITAEASPLHLQRPPISSTLGIELKGQILKRSRRSGFTYDAANRSVTFNGAPFKPGDQVIAAYRSFVGAK